VLETIYQPSIPNPDFCANSIQLTLEVRGGLEGLALRAVPGSPGEVPGGNRGALPRGVDVKPRAGAPTFGRF